MEKQKVLFVCIHNAARSQMAEAFLKQLAGNRFDVESAGLEPGRLNPFIVRVMQEIGIDISRNKTKSTFELFEQRKKFHYVIAVCDAEAAERCPVFPGTIEKIHWAFPDPARFQGTDNEKMAFARNVRDAIRVKVEEWIKSL